MSDTEEMKEPKDNDLFRSVANILAELQSRDDSQARTTASDGDYEDGRESDSSEVLRNP
jgi:hypothetical protein